ncbi:MAG: response regulator transcription factor [Thermoleophilia bacterium]
MVRGLVAASADREARRTIHILIVEDEVKLARALKRGLEAEGYAVDLLHDGAAAWRRLRSAGDDDLRYDLLLLDVMLPGVDGLTLCRDARDWGLAIPILMLTARDATDDKVAGLDSGADDYLVKPFAFAELLARIRTLLRRPASALPLTLVVGDLSLDPARRDVRVGGVPVELSAKEFGLLELFMRHPGQVLSRERVLDHVWDEHYDSFSNTVDVYVGRLRRKLDRAGAPTRFKAKRGAGYVLRGDAIPGGDEVSGADGAASAGVALGGEASGGDGGSRPEGVSIVDDSTHGRR